MKLFRSKSENNKEPYDEFIATVKLCSGEEILTKVIVDYSSQDEQIIIAVSYTHLTLPTSYLE